ncbi:MAG: ABC transporter permease [Ignavibacteria bacterium]
MISFIGRKFIQFFTELGQFSRLMTGVIKNLPRVFRDRKLILEQMMHVGVNSLTLVTIIGIFTGAVSCWQAAYQIKGLISYSYLGSATTKAIIIELGHTGSYCSCRKSRRIYGCRARNHESY